jgi:EAL domain-containing protein (putative c-di-GMP-specific phosphodiesterase class I)
LLALEHMINTRAFAGFASLPDFAARTLFVNFDSRLIGLEGDLVERLGNHLKRANIPPSSICFELSERFDSGKMPDFSGLVKKVAAGRFQVGDR